MLFRDVIELISVEYTDDGLGGVNEAHSNRQVFANKKSIRQNEFYQAQQVGLNPTVMFEVRTADYNGEKSLLYDGKEYTVIRTYNKNGEFMELVCFND